MLGKASEIKTLLVKEINNEEFDDTLNGILGWLAINKNADVISIKTAVVEIDDYHWWQALIIYKEASHEN